MCPDGCISGMCLAPDFPACSFIHFTAQSLSLMDSLGSISPQPKKNNQIFNCLHWTLLFSSPLPHLFSQRPLPFLASDNGRVFLFVPCKRILRSRQDQNLDSLSVPLLGSVYNLWTTMTLAAEEMSSLSIWHWLSPLYFQWFPHKVVGIMLKYALRCCRLFPPFVCLLSDVKAPETRETLSVKTQGRGFCREEIWNYPVVLEVSLSLFVSEETLGAE